MRLLRDLIFVGMHAYTLILRFLLDKSNRTKHNATYYTDLDTCCGHDSLHTEFITVAEV